MNAERLEQVEVVLGAWKLGVDNGLVGCPRQLAGEVAGVLDQHERVERPMDVRNGGASARRYPSGELGASSSLPAGP